VNSAIIYIRVSTTEQVERISLDYQRKVCEDFAAKKDATVEHVFREEGESAKTAHRTELIRAIEYCHKHKGRIAYFIVYKLDRFARNSEDHYAIRSMLAKVGVRLLSATEPIDDSPAGKFMESMLAAVAEFDNSVRSERTRGGMQARVEQGGWPHPAPIGYVNRRDERGRPTLAVDPVAGPLVRQMLREFLNGAYSQREITHYGRALGLKTRGGNRLSYQSIQHILRNPIYAGLIRSSMTGGLVKGLHPALLSEDEYYRLQLKLTPRLAVPEHHKTDHPAYPLRRGFLRCARCNNSLRGSAPKGRSRYYPRYHCVVCKTSQTGAPISGPVEVVHAQFHQLLQRVRPRDEVLELFRETVIRRWDSELRSERDVRRRLQHHIGEIEEKMTRVIDLYVDRKLSDTQKEAQLGKLEHELIALRGSLSETKKDEGDKDAVLANALTFMTNIPKLWTSLDANTRPHFMRLVFPNGLAYDFEKGWWNPVLGLAFEIIQESANDKSNLVPLDDNRWHQLKQHLGSLAEFMRKHHETPNAA
jgi:site-specific DNA recombinase